jgi:hypothetical protein
MVDVARAAEVLENGRDQLVDGSVELSRRLVARYEGVSERSQREAAGPIFAATAHLLRGAPAGDLADVVRSMLLHRATEGFTPAELALITHSYFRPLRRLLVAELGAEDGNAAFDLLEDKALDGLRLVLTALGS